MTIEIEKLLKTVKTEAEKVDAAMRRDLAELRPTVDPLLIETLEYGLFNGGKRVRPLLVVMAARLCGCLDDKVYELAKAFEYLHAATLFHDDVLDNAELRRGKPSVYRHFGLIPAILAGDFLHARSMEIVGNLAGDKGLSTFCQATAGMVDGEFMQLRNAVQLNMAESDYYDAIMGKTGLLIAASCEIGAIYGGGDREQQSRLREYGVGIGCAFQMIDDLLDYTGDAATTGKAIGNDLAEGKMTLPLIVALKNADTVDLQYLKDVLADEAKRVSEFEKVKQLLEKYNGFTETREKAEEHVTKAFSGLNCFDGERADSFISTLKGLGQYILDRKK